MPTTRSDAFRRLHRRWTLQMLALTVAAGLVVLGLALAVPASASADAPPLTKRDARTFLSTVLEGENATQVLRQLDPTIDGAGAFVGNTRDNARRVGRSAVVYHVAFVVNRDGAASTGTVKFIVRRSAENGAATANIWLGPVR